jgi:putative ABC transport system substrate-binding protein
MHRRTFLAGAAASLSLGLPRPARTADIHRVGYISTSTTDPDSPYLIALRDGLKEHGYEEGRNLVIAYRFGRSRDELPAMAADLVTQRVELIVAGGSEGIVAAKDATRTIPIVMANSGDAVREGFAQSLAKPGGNITGMTQISPELVGKRLEMLRELFRDLKQVGILWNPVHPNTPFEFEEARIATEKLGLEPHAIEAREPGDIRLGLMRQAQRGVRAFLVIRDPFTVRNRVAIARTLDEFHLAAVFETSDFVDAGGMMYYGADFADLFRRSAAFVDKILRGARPADLPIEQPAKFKMVINKRVAERRGLELPRSLLIRADEVIE